MLISSYLIKIYILFHVSAVDGSAVFQVLLQLWAIRQRKLSPAFRFAPSTLIYVDVYLC